MLRRRSACRPQGARRRSLDELLDSLELVAPSALEQLEQGGLDAGDRGAGPLYHVQPDLAVLRRARGDGNAGDVHVDAAVQEVENRLVDADVRLDPAQQRLVPPLQVEPLGL